ncbi:unnamed protein product [Menidia menidia]|uniref:(Atlantic silverside) hypothetical protein n=1 Tax=Menidia menidia TaxID=238744 RepID=A0A8S4BY53_9TELE|nr:unnamed protein product [Menidia menidia]
MCGGSLVGSLGSVTEQVQFRVDESFLRPSEKRSFLRYLADHNMHIDIWNSDSLLLIGSTAIELKHMLRHGKSAVQAHHELEVLTTDYVAEDTFLTSADLGRHSASNPISVHTIVRGRRIISSVRVVQHLETDNVTKSKTTTPASTTGCSVDPCRRRDEMPAYSHIITPCEVTSGFRGGSLSPRNILQLNARNSAQVCRLDTSWDQTPPFRLDAITPNERSLGDSNSERRKLDCMAAVRQREAMEAAKAAKFTGHTEDSLSGRQLYQGKLSEEHSKAEGIANMLSLAITTQHFLFASLGSAEYMEFVLKNPFNVPQTVTVYSDDPELSVITNTEEWCYFKALTKTPTAVEENMFHMKEDDPVPRVYLRPKESIHIPLKYQSFLCDHTTAHQGPSFLPRSKGSQMAKKNPSNVITAKTIKVTFKAEDGKPMAICQVNVEPVPHIVGQTFRLYHPERCFLKKAIRVSSCIDPAGRSDKWMAAPSQIWQIYVHFLERVDISCVTGQRSCQSVVLRGKQAVRKVKCFSSHPKEIEVDPGGVFVLPPAAVQELQLKVQPWRAGSRFLYVNAVDVEQRSLVTAWLLCLSVHRPVLSKAFEVCVPVGGGRGSSRKITYTNPYTSSRMFLLRSDHPDLLQFREDKFQIGGGESYTIGLRFAPSQSPGLAEILVYVNNLEEKTEETFCVKVNYS